MIRQVRLSDLDRCYEIEKIAYDGSEAATREKIEKRIQCYPQGFFVYETEGLVVGLINSASADHIEMANDDIKELVGHHDNGKHMVIMSLAVHPGYQRKGYGRQLLNFFIEHARNLGKESIYLMCQRYLIPFYSGFGFVSQGVSESNHGDLTWHEMQLQLF
ncbi:MAG: GNAT family N-acetyltransferase [Reinekea sp.]|jgi:ribosomal protein S18 acetylase RimI-like enzyme